MLAGRLVSSSVYSLSTVRSITTMPRTASKRARVSTSPLSPPSPAKKPRAKPAKADAAPKAAKTPKAAKWPPADLAPPYPARLGFPVYAFTDTPGVTSLNGVNGGIAPLNPAEPLRVGAHVSMAGGQATALMRASMLGANGIALFVKGHRAWKSKEMDEVAIQRWEDVWGDGEGRLGYDAHDVLVHGNYLINLGNPDEWVRSWLTDTRAKWAQAYECFRDDLDRCHKLGIRLYNWQ